MFEVGFSEILVIMAIALVVLGPEKLPKLAATVGRWMGRAKAMARQFKEQLEEEANKLELTKELNKQMDLAKSRLDLAKSLGLTEEDLKPTAHPPAAQTTAPEPPPADPPPHTAAAEPQPPEGETPPENAPTGTPTAAPPIEASVDSVHERRH